MCRIVGTICKKAAVRKILIRQEVLRIGASNLEIDPLKADCQQKEIFESTLHIPKSWAVTVLSLCALTDVAGLL